MTTTFLSSNLRLTLLAAFASVRLVAGPLETPSQAVTVDPTPVIKIGDFTTSRYLFEKNYNQLIGAGSVRRVQKARTREELNHWFELYLARLVIKADLVEKKQLGRPEVVALTGQMARYMLTQPLGPLYRELGGTDPLAFRRDRRTLILKIAQFSAFPENIQTLWAAVAASFQQGVVPRDAEVESIRSIILATYNFDGVTKRISALDFAHDFQQGIARMSPRDMKNLSDQIEDIAVAEYDLAEAKKRRLDQTAQFLEDRHNFALNQALALHEKEVLSRQLDLSPVALASYYQKNLPRYSSPEEIKGSLFIFLDLENARRGMTSVQVGSDPYFAPGISETIEPFAVQRDAPSIFANVTYAFLASAPVGQSCGPFAYAGKYAVLLKRANGNVSPIPLGAVQDQVLHDLSRDKIEMLELEYLAQNVDRVQLILDLSTYQIDNPLPRLKAEAKAPVAAKEGKTSAAN